MTSEQFHFTGADGKDYTLPRQIPSGVLRRVRGMDNVDASYTLLESCGSPEAIEAHDGLEALAGLEILNEWVRGMKPGESSPSSN